MIAYADSGKTAGSETVEFNLNDYITNADWDACPIQYTLGATEGGDLGDDEAAIFTIEDGVLKADELAYDGSDMAFKITMMTGSE